MAKKLSHGLHRTITVSLVSWVSLRGGVKGESVANIAHQESQNTRICGSALLFLGVMHWVDGAGTEEEKFNSFHYVEFNNLVMSCPNLCCDSFEIYKLVCFHI